MPAQDFSTAQSTAPTEPSEIFFISTAASRKPPIVPALFTTPKAATDTPDICITPKATPHYHKRQRFLLLFVMPSSPHRVTNHKSQHLSPLQELHLEQVVFILFIFKFWTNYFVTNIANTFQYCCLECQRLKIVNISRNEDSSRNNC